MRHSGFSLETYLKRREIAKFPVNFPVTRDANGDRFVSDCAHHHPVFPNRGNRRRSKRGPFLRGSCRLFSMFPVSADKNGLSGGFWASGLCIQKFRSRRQGFREPALGNRLLRCELRAASKPIADSIRGFRTAGSIPREHRVVVRPQCRDAATKARMHFYSPP